MTMLLLFKLIISLPLFSFRLFPALPCPALPCPARSFIYFSSLSSYLSPLISLLLSLSSPLSPLTISQTSQETYMSSARTYLHRTCCEVRTLCFSFIEASSLSHRTALALYSLKRATGFTPHQNSNTGESSNPCVILNEKEISKNSTAIAESVARTVLTGCLIQTKSKTPLSPILRIQTIHSENTPDKGTVVWYLQQKKIICTDCTYSTDILGVKTRGVRSVLLLECLEGKLVGVHKEGNEEPFYTVSLSTPIPGAAGNTVREVQTTGYRYVRSYVRSFILFLTFIFLFTVLFLHINFRLFCWYITFLCDRTYRSFHRIFRKSISQSKLRI